MCHKVVFRGDEFATYYDFGFGRFCGVGLKKFCLTEEGLAPTMRAVEEKYKIRLKDGRVWITHKKAPCKQVVEFHLGTSCVIEKVFKAGIHISPIESRMVAVPVGFLFEDLLFYDGHDISVSRMYLLGEKDANYLSKKYQFYVRQSVYDKVKEVLKLEELPNWY